VSFVVEIGADVACVANGRKEKYVGRLFVATSRRKRPLEEPRRRWVNNVKMDFVQIGWGGVEGIGLVHNNYEQRALVNAVMNFLVP
jgi:hypothetical protein